MKRPHRFVLALLLTIGVALTGCVNTHKAPPNAPPTSGDVAILVVDDFGLGKKDYGDGADFPDENCTVGSTDVGSNGADDGSQSDYPHGELVYKVLRDELGKVFGNASPAASPPSLTSTTSTPRPGGQENLPALETSAEWQYQFQGKGYRVRLVAAHAANFRTGEVLSEIGASLDLLRKANFDRFVINLSFVVVPCDVMKWLDDSEVGGLLKTYNEMLKDESLRNGLAGYTSGDLLTGETVRRPGFAVRVLQREELVSMRQYLVSVIYRKINLAMSRGDTDLLMTQVYGDSAWSSFLDDWVLPGVTASGASPTADPPPRVVPVGAAGNGIKYGNPPNLTRMGLKFPFAPALWDFVVSATAPSPWKEYDVLNSGEVILDGNGPSDLAPDSFGTSFAAPRLSALEARYLLETGRVRCDGKTPALGYVDLTLGSSVNVTTSSPWQNKDKSQWPNICNDFPQG